MRRCIDCEHFVCDECMDEAHNEEEALRFVHCESFVSRCYDLDAIYAHADEQALQLYKEAVKDVVYEKDEVGDAL